MYKTLAVQESFQLLFTMRCFVTFYVTFLERSKATLSLDTKQADELGKGAITRFQK